MSKPVALKLALAFYLVGVVIFVGSCGSPDEAGDTTETHSPPTSGSLTSRAAPITTESLPADLSVPPTGFYEPPLELGGLVGRPSEDAVKWGEAQGFELIVIVPPGGDVETVMLPSRLLVMVDGEGIVLKAQQG